MTSLDKPHPAAMLLYTVNTTTTYVELPIQKQQP